MTVVFDGNGSTLRLQSYTATDVAFTTTLVDIDEQIANPGMTQSVIDDGLYDVNVSAVVRHSGQIYADGYVSYEAYNPSIGTVDSSGRVTWVSNGTAQILVRSLQGMKSVFVPVSQSSPSTQSVFLRFADGTLGKHVSDQVDNRIAGKNATTAKALFTTAISSPAQYVRNTSFWAADVDLTGISPWNSDGGNRKAGVLITKKHIAFANHFTIANGSTIRFVTQDNQVVDRTLSSSTQVAGTDIRIGVLDSEVPSSIAFYKVFPSSFTAKVKSISKGVPGLGLDQEEKGLVIEGRSATGSSWLCQKPTQSQRVSFYEDIISGDSGNPFFLLVNNALVLCTTWTNGGAGSGPNYIDSISAINSVLSSLSPGGGYTVTQADLSAFPSF